MSLEGNGGLASILIDVWLLDDGFRTRYFHGRLAGNNRLPMRWHAS
jgi:hypothetical protein